jgi:cbb3-type cytochrome oxidase subunit 3
MTSPRAPLSFGQHSLAVLGAAIIGSTVFALGWGIALTVAVGGNGLPLTQLTLLTALCWLAVFIMALPSAGIAFSLLWPLARHRTSASRWLCLAGAVATGVTLAPITSPGARGASPLQLVTFAAAACVVAGIYLMLTRGARQASASATNGVTAAAFTPQN